MKKRRIVLKLSGQALAGENKVGISHTKVNEIAAEIKALYDLGDIELSIVVGAGNIWRGRDVYDSGMDRSSADYMGMLATILNALALQNALEKLGLDTRAMTSLHIPEVAEPYIRRKALSHLSKGRIVIFGGGNGIPFFTTDTTAALRSAELGASLILMAKNGVDGVYDCDPRGNNGAKKFTTLTHQEVLEKHLDVMDLTAATLCKENDIDIFVFDMNVKGNIARAVDDFSIGTLITNKLKK
ncbi:MAG TPA: UMP kinase [Acholeplasmataceae bacterium]|nr:UMP kinase [Acholeplasmataceae bacterium]